MEAKSFKFDDLVWAKMKGYPPWPAKIVRPLPNVKCPNIKKSHHFVFFFASKNFAWIQDANIFLHTEDMLISSKSYKKPSKQLLSAIEEIKKLASGDVSTEEEIEVDEPAPPVKTDDTPRKGGPKDDKKAGKITSPKRSVSSEEQETPLKKKKILKPEIKRKSNTMKKIIKVKLPITHSPKRSADGKRRSGEKSTLTKAQKLREKYSELFANCPPNLGFSRVAVIRPYEEVPSTSSSILTRRDYFERPKTPPIDLSCLAHAPHNDQASKKQFGFLGLGMMGRGIVKNLLSTGHKVTIWNRNPEKCSDFIKAGAKLCTTPGDVAAECDITFCCISDISYCKEAVTGNCGVVKTLKSNYEAPITGKGYVVLTSLDPTTSVEIGTALTDIGVPYLEVPMVGDRQLAEKGTLLLLASGDKDLYQECESCFKAISSEILYFGPEIGPATKLKLCHSMFQGSMFAALAEAMALLERCKISESSFFEIIGMSQFNNPLLMEKVKAMQMRAFATNTALRHQQKDMGCALNLALGTFQSLPIAAAANELFKSAMLRGYSDHDVAAVLLGAKY